MDNEKPKFTSLEDVVTKWQMKYGTETRSKGWGAVYHMIPVGERFDLFKILVKELKDMGKGKEYFTQTNKDLIVEKCIPVKKSVSPDSYNGFLNGTRTHLNKAIIAVFDEVELKKSTENDMEEFVPSTKKDEDVIRDVFDPEMAELLGLK